MTRIPHESTLDSSLNLLTEGYPFLNNRVKRFQSNIFQTRLLFQKAVCLHGPEATEVFYNPELFTRKGAIPERVQKTLLGEDGVQTMAGEEHRHRKAMFMALMAPDSLQILKDHLKRFWLAYSRKWEHMDQVVLFDDAQEVFCLAACSWAGVPLKPEEVRTRAQDFAAMVDAFGAVGPRHWRGRWARDRGEKWTKGIIKKIRNGKLTVPEASPAHVIALHRDLEGELLSTRMAAIELINVIRPTVAIAYFVVFTALALYEHPEYRQKLQYDDGRLTEMFVQEVRRFYPFAPFVGARVRKKFKWGGHKFKKGNLVLLDIYGPLHDEALWEQPYAFRPERFQNWEGSPFNFIPQGGGDYLNNHRCAGEWLTIEAMKVSLDFLTNDVVYEVPEQDLSFSLARIPTYPKSGFIIRKVRRMNREAYNSYPGSSSTGAQCPFHKGV
ncbi:fatty-acid peroxygenase [Pontibacter ummariensis]|uniref:Fatty-acid peroxygenase n=1 Tax=Pontibacter ummariensis TaxID=1610492 RepID=A0A239M0M0_9BACT|nr:cytochrome P450 [Pontibacter ummariensis]PRX99271.1 fatty-acid peroxygenase [Pontibacter ummariensis]SNT36050.1 fatty-acid peroxygenase [Pontibacter ummariensis]